MRSNQVTNGETIFAQNLTALRSDARAGGQFHAHQQFGAIALPTNPTNGQTLTLTINSTAIVITFVSAIGTTAGNVLIGATAAATAISLQSLLANSNVTNSTQVALSSANQLLVSYLSWALSATTITPGSLNTLIGSPLSTFTSSTTVTGGSYTANTMRLYVEPGTCFVNGAIVYFTGGSTPTVTAPSVNPRIDVLTIDSSGTLAWTTGAENASPVVPTYPVNKIPICELYNVTGETVLYDISNKVAGGGYVNNDVRTYMQGIYSPGAVPTDFIPDGDGTRNLGSVSKEWNNLYVKTGIFLGGVSVNSQNTSSFTAGETVAAGTPVCALSYPVNTVLYDNSVSSSGTTTGTTLTISFAIAANSNMHLTVFAVVNDGTHTITGITQNGNAMSQIDGGIGASNGQRGYSFGLAAPTSGTHNIVITTNASSIPLNYWVYSYYNVVQNSVPTSHAAEDIAGGGGGPQNFNFNPILNGSIVLGGVMRGTSSISGVPANNQTGSGQQIFGDTGAEYPMVITTITATYGGSGSAPIFFVALDPIQTSATTRVYKTMTTIAQRAASYIGVAQGASTAGNPVTVATAGIDQNQSGLVIGTQYYLADSPGTFGTAAGTISRKAGIASGATNLLITNIW